MGEFRHLRMAPQGSALRTRGLLKKAGENFNTGAVPGSVPYNN